MSGSNKSYLPSQRMMPVYTTISPPGTDRASVPEFPYDAVPSKALPRTSPYIVDEASSSQPKPPAYGRHGNESPKSVSGSMYPRVQEFPYDPPDKSKPPDYAYESLTNGGKPGPGPPPHPVGYPRGGDDKGSPTNLALAYPRMQDFPYGLSGVAMPNYNYSSELYSYVSNGFPRKSRMCSYCGKVFTRSTTRRYHEKRCPLLRAAGSLLKNESNKEAVSAAVAAATAAKSDASHHLASYVSPNSLYTPMTSSPHTSFSLAGVSTQPYVSTSNAGVDQNRNAVGAIKGEPQDAMDDASPTNSDTFSQGEASTNRYTPDSESANPGSVFPAVPQDRSSESPMSLPADNNNQTASDAHDTGEPAVFRNGSDQGSGEVARVSGGRDDVAVYHPGAATAYQRYKDIHASRQSSHLSGKATNSYNDNLSQGTSGDGSLNQDSDQTLEEGESIDDSKSGESSKKSVLANKCSICSKTFDSARQLHIHEQLHTKYKPYACRFCGQRFLKVSMRIAHERLHIGEKPYVCAICGLTFTRKYSVRLHMRRRHADGPCLCRYCGKTLYTLQTLKTHLLTHSLPKSEKESLHYLGTSGGERLDTEPGDSQPAASSTSSQPQQQQQSGQEDHQTQINKDLAVAMEMELAGNSKEKEWCKICEKDFPKSFMRYHERLHADQKPYECPTCKKRFGYKNNMKSHMKLHAGIKPYQCHVCGAKFTRGSTLRRHARRHGIYTESVWDFFVQKGVNSGKANNVSKDQAKAEAKPGKVESQPSPELQRAALSERDRAAATPDSSMSYELGSYAGAAALASNLYAGYNAVASLPESIYHAYPSTSHFNVNYPVTFPASQPGPEPQADALNLSVHKAATHAMMQASAAAVAAASAAAAAKATAEKDDNMSEENGDEIESKSNNISSHSSTLAGASVGVQVNLCGCPDRASSSGLNSLPPFDARMPSPLNMDGSATTATSPSLSSGGDNFNQESISTLMGSGRLFRCPHCDCYFSEYAMYRIHQKLHARDANRPFLCPVCFEDCHDKMYYALHLYEHLRM